MKNNISENTNYSDNEFSPMWKDSLFTLISSGTVILLSIVLTGLLSRKMQIFDFENYLFIRRFISFLFPFTTLSIGVGLTQVLAREKSNPLAQGAACKGTLVLLFLFNLILLGITYVVPEQVIKNYLFPISSEHSTLWKITFLWLTAYSGYIMLYSYYRGKINMNKANLLNLAANGIFPLLTLLSLSFYNALNTANFLIIWAAGYCFSFILLGIYVGNMLKNFKDSIIYACKNVLTYSIARIPAGLLLAVIPYLIPFFMKKSGQQAVYFLSGLLLIQAIHYLTDPLGQVFLPRSALWYGTKNHSQLSILLNNVVSFSLQIGIILTIQIYIWSDLISLTWFGKGYEQSGQAIQYLSFLIIPALLFNTTRNVLDGIEKKALITTHLAYSTILSILLCVILYIASALTLFSACMVALVHQAFTVLLILQSLKKRVEFSIKASHIIESLFLGITLGICSFILHRLSWQTSVFISIILMGFSALVCVIATILWAYFRKPYWWENFYKNL